MEIANETSETAAISCKERHKQLLSLGPKQITPPTYGHAYGVRFEGIQSSTEGQRPLQHSLSKITFEETPSWLDDLLNEPETPVHRNHRRSSSDSIAYIHTPDKAFFTKDEYQFQHSTTGPSKEFQNFHHYKDSWHGSFNTKPSTSPKQQTNKGQTYVSREPEVVAPAATEKQHRGESVSQEEPSERNDAKSSVSRTDSKRAKQQSAHQSRLRKLQYIAELERFAQALQVEGFQVSAELEFLDQQNLILGIENTALKQQLDNLSQKQNIKYMETDLLERELQRLRNLYHHQLQQLQPAQHFIPQAPKSQTINSQFASLSIKHNESNSSGIPLVTQCASHLHIPDFLQSKWEN